MAKNNGTILVERETFEMKGNTYFSYFIRGNVRGKDVKVSIVPPDKGGYTVLDIVFGDANTANLMVKPFEIKDDATIIDVHVTVKFGVKINDIAYNLQKKVKNSVESYAGLDNITVNVFVDGIENENAPKEDKEEEKAL